MKKTAAKKSPVILAFSGAKKAGLFFYKILRFLSLRTGRKRGFSAIMIL